MACDYIIKDGKTDYKILIPVKAEEDEISAANELQFFIKESTAVLLEITDKSTDDVHYFSIGNTDLLKANGFKTDYSELGEQGFKIKTKGGNVFI